MTYVYKRQELAAKLRVFAEQLEDIDTYGTAPSTLQDDLDDLANTLSELADEIEEV